MTQNSPGKMLYLQGHLSRAEIEETLRACTEEGHHYKFTHTYFRNVPLPGQDATRFVIAHRPGQGAAPYTLVDFGTDNENATYSNVYRPKSDATSEQVQQDLKPGKPLFFGMIKQALKEALAEYLEGDSMTAQYRQWAWECRAKQQKEGEA